MLRREATEPCVRRAWDRSRRFPNSSWRPRLGTLIHLVHGAVVCPDGDDAEYLRVYSSHLTPMGHSLRPANRHRVSLRGFPHGGRMRLISPLMTTLAASVLAVSLFPGTAAATPRSNSIPLPDDFEPEGIAIGTGNTFYVGSLRTGDIYRGDLRTGEGSIFVDAGNRVAVGMRVDKSRHWLVVAGGATGHAWVYNTDDGSTVADLVLGAPGVTFSNDVAITKDALYFTETFAPTIYKVPIQAHGTFGTTDPITITGPAAATGVGFGLNGIDSTNRGWLIVDHTNAGIIALVNPSTGASQEISLSGQGLI